MKLSLRWLCDHMVVDYKTLDVQGLIARFNKTTAETEGLDHIHSPVHTWFVATVQTADSNAITAEIPELSQTVSLPQRNGVVLGTTYMTVKQEDGYRWLTMADAGSGKEGLFPAVTIAQDKMAGAWRDSVESHDYIIHLDNKSVNHRPDLWGHRGVARELAALLGVSLVPLDTLIVKQQIDAQADAGTTGSFTIRNVSEGECSRFAGLYVTDVHNTSSSLHVALRLARVDSRPIDAVVDATNYVMLDMSQPLHAFDADRIPSNYVVVRQAKNKEQLVLLDGTTVTLTGDDIVMSDDKRVLSLAGIMGGSDTAVSVNTKSLLVESATFDAATIRRTSARLKKRTESSARFEKNLDPHQNVIGIQRFLHVLHQQGISAVAQAPICSLGKEPEPTIITVAHQFIESRIGVAIDPEFVIKTLRALDFQVEQRQSSYIITVPTFRATKDVRIPEDIVEEVGRFFGYDTLPIVYPVRQMKSFSLTHVLRERAIKHQLAYGLQMREVQTYAFFDENFIKELQFDPGVTLQVKEPVSENWQRLVTSLVPNISKMVHQHAADYDAFRFFELASIWPLGQGEHVERKSVAGIIADQKKTIDFYAAKAELQTLFQALGIPVTWAQASGDVMPWYAPYQTAWLYHGQHVIGTAGMAHPGWYARVAAGSAFIFELDAGFLLTYQQAAQRYHASSKYQRVVRDLSMLLPRSVVAHEIEKIIASADERVIKVSVIDFFEKPEWPDSKSLTIRMTIEDQHKTLSSQDIDQIVQSMTQLLTAHGAQIR